MLYYLDNKNGFLKEYNLIKNNKNALSLIIKYNLIKNK